MLITFLNYVCLIEFFIGLLCFHKFDKQLKIFFGTSVVGAGHEFLFSLMKNPVQINIEQLVFMVLVGTIYFSYFLCLMKQPNRNRILVVFFGVSLLLTFVEIKFFGINTYRIWFTDIVIYFFLLIFSIFSLVKISFENISSDKKIINNLIGIPLIFYFIFVIYDDITIGLLWKSPAKQYIDIFSGITSSVSILSTICNIIAYLCQPKQESYLQHH